MATLYQDIPNLFAAGNYQKIADSSETYDSAEHLELVLGSLCFIGRVDEASLYYDQYRDRLDRSQLVACRFFLGITFTRLAKTEDALQYFIKNMMVLRESPSPVERFYIYQGLAFYRNLGSRYLASLKAADKAWQAAVECKFLWGRVLASDLKGQSLIHTGFLQLGIQSLKEANRIAVKIGNEALATATEFSISISDAISGKDPISVVDSLVNRLETLAPQDNYSRIGLLIELGRELSLRGRIRESDYYLEEASKTIYATQHKRYEGFLNFRFAYNRFLSGDFAEAENFIYKSLSVLDQKIHLQLQIKCMGLLKRIQDHLDKPVDSVLDEKLTGLINYTGFGMGRRIQNREGQIMASFKVGDDPLGDLIDRVYEGANLWENIDRIVKSGYLSFLPAMLGLNPKKKHLVLDLIPNTLLIVDKGNLRVCDKGLTPAIRACLKSLAEKKSSKGDLIQSVWGYRYDPLRHDPLIYGLMGRIRSLLNEYSGWINAVDGCYELDAHVDISFLSPKIPTMEKQTTVFQEPKPLELSLEKDLSFQEFEDFDLNLRQLKFLTTIQAKEFYTVGNYQKMFPEISRITASRDLSSMVKYKLLKRAGKARATSYYRTSI